MKKEELLELARFQHSRIILTAVELEIFSALKSPASASEVASRLNLAVEGTTRILNALTAMGILELDGDTYSPAQELDEVLGDGPESVIPSLKHRARLWKTWNALPEIVRTGKHYYELYESEGRSSRDVKAFTLAMAVSGKNYAAETVDAIDLSGVSSVLDIGGGPGVYAEAFIDAPGEIRIAVLDRSGVKDVAMERMKDGPYEGKVEYIEGDVLGIDDRDVTGEKGEKQFDLIFMSNLIHSMSPDEIERLFIRCVDWCNEGGRIAVKDFFMDETRTQPLNGAIFAINMLVNTADGNSYKWSEVERWLREAAAKNGKSGISKISRVEFEHGRGGMIIAETGR